MSNSLTVEQMLVMLEEAPPRIAAVTAGLTPDQLHAAPGPGEWSAREVLGHMLACNDIWGKSIRTILAEDRPKFQAVSPRTWIKKTDYLEQEFQSLLEVFTKERSDLLAVLRVLAPEDWLRSATVSVAGKPFERTVLYYAEWLATHERSHVKQVARIASFLSTAHQP